MFISVHLDVESGEILKCLGMIFFWGDFLNLLLIFAHKPHVTKFCDILHVTLTSQRIIQIQEQCYALI